MGAFDDVTLNWHDRDYTVPANKVMGAIARIEDVVTLVELHSYLEKGSMPLAKIAMAYATVLRYAGAYVKDEEVYEGMFADAQAQANVTTAVGGLLGMMLPKSAKATNGQAGPPEANPTKRRGAAANTSKAASKSR